LNILDWIDVGKVSAERDDDLEQYFFDNGLLRTVIDSPSSFLILGRKGAGKTAVFRHLCNKRGNFIKIRLPSGCVNLEDSELENINIDTGEVSFEDVKRDKTLQRYLSENLSNILDLLERSIESCLDQLPRIFICFDRVDESWDEVSFDSSKLVIAGLVVASDSITSKYRGKIRPLIFLREDIFDVLSINDANKLREDCGALLHWNRTTLARMILHRINYFASLRDIAPIEEVDILFDKSEMRQRLKPSNYLIKRTMMRPRDLISLFSRLIKTMKEQAANSLFDENYEKLSSSSVYTAEPGYSEWLEQEVIDEWKVQKPEIVDLFNALRNNGSTNFNKADLGRELDNLRENIKHNELDKYLRFLFDNSIIGFKLGESLEWRFKCFYPSQGYLDSTEYRIHEGLVRSLNLRENRDR